MTSGTCDTKRKSCTSPATTIAGGGVTARWRRDVVPGNRAVSVAPKHSFNRCYIALNSMF